LHPLLHRFDSPARLLCSALSAKTHPVSSILPDFVGMRKVPFSEDVMVALLATVTRKSLHRCRFCKCLASDFKTKMSVHPESAVIAAEELCAVCSLELVFLSCWFGANWFGVREL
jgi:hypothetical protein